MFNVKFEGPKIWNSVNNKIQTSLWRFSKQVENLNMLKATELQK